VFEDEGAFVFLVKRKNGVAAEILHGADQVEAGLSGHEVAVKSISGKRACHGAIGTDEPQVEAELLGDRESEGVAAPGNENDFDARGVGAAQGGEIWFGYFELGIEQCAVDIGCDESDGIRLPAGVFGSW